MTQFRGKVLPAAVAGLILGVLPCAGEQSLGPTAVAGVYLFTHPSIEQQVYCQLNMLAYYGVFESLAYQIDDQTLILSGHVLHARLKTAAESVLQKIPEVRRIRNEIQVLPDSVSDGRIRLALFRAIYVTSPLRYYATESVPPIRIIVENGNVTLDGVVSSTSDKDTATTLVKSTPGVHSVKDNLRVVQ